MNSWYAGLQRPPLTPPNWVFATVWSVIYLMIGVSFLLHFKSRKSKEFMLSTVLPIGHIGTNLAWTPLFFRFQSPGAALIDILLLDLSLVAIIFQFWKTNRLSSLLLVPYLLWFLFATYLNAGFYLLNRQQSRRIEWTDFCFFSCYALSSTHGRLLGYIGRQELIGWPPNGFHFHAVLLHGVCSPLSLPKNPEERFNPLAIRVRYPEMADVHKIIGVVLRSRSRKRP